MLLPAVMIPITIVSHFISAFVLRRLKHNVKKTVLLVVVLQVVTVVLIFIPMFSGCPGLDIAGKTIPYNKRYVNIGDVFL